MLDQSYLEKYVAPHIEGRSKIALGLSGGPDSMALARLLSIWAQERAGLEIHALIIDHAIRTESGQEASLTKQRVEDWPHITPVILTCEGLVDEETRLMERARQARYTLFESYCAQEGITALCLAHHQNDQAETFLFRLAKGSGLDGLASMAPVQTYSENLTLLRPLLDVPKSDLIEFCTVTATEYVHDPSNEKEQFARPRLRKSAQILEEEGLSAKRLSVTARRLARAKEALQQIAIETFDKILLEKNTNRIVLTLSGVRKALDEIAFRTILMAVEYLNHERDYLPRMERLEDLFEDVKTGKEFRKRTLGGLIFECDEGRDQLIIHKEPKKDGK